MTVPRVLRTRLVTSVVNQVTFRVIAPTQLPTALDVVDSPPAVVGTRSATSAQRSAISHAIAPRPADMVAKVVDMAVIKEDMAVAAMAVDVKAVKLVTLAEDMVTCLVTARKARSATTAVRLVISLETALPRPATSELATSASNPAMFRLNARTKPFPAQYLH